MLKREKKDEVLAKQKPPKRKTAIAIAGGVFTGAINGIFGGGGGMIAVPLLNKVLGEKTKVAHASAILVILPITIASAVMYIIGGYFEAVPTFSTMVGVVVGGIIGAFALKKLNAKLVAFIFALMMIAAGVKLVIG